MTGQWLIDAHIKTAEDLRDRVNSLEAENAALREDKARLDEYEKQVPEGFDWTITHLDSGGWKVEPLRITAAELGWGPHYPTARAAIDAARKEVPSGNL